jgi:hypothetical protein
MCWLPRITRWFGKAWWMRQILAESPLSVIVVLTNLEGQEQACLRAVVLKDVSKAELLTAIRAAQE